MKASKLVAVLAPAAAALLSGATPALAICKQIAFEWKASNGPALPAIKATYQATYPHNQKRIKKGDRDEADTEQKKDPSTETLRIKTVLVDKKTLLHHSTTFAGIKQIMVKDDKTEMKTWF